MSAATVSVRLELDKETHKAMSEWSIDERRSARDQAASLMWKLAKLRKEQPDELARLGLLDRLMVRPQ